MPIFRNNKRTKLKTNPINIYLFQKKTVEDTNPYLEHLEILISQKFNLVNKAKNRIGILDIFRYLRKANIFYFNWVENLPQNRYGKFQSLVLFCFLKLARPLNIKILWTLHNKYSHGKNKNRWTDFLYRVLIKHTDLILTHSFSGVEFIRNHYPKYISKVKYISHPISEIFPKLAEEKKIYDFLIWGEVHPYKGIKEFLEFVSKNEVLKSTKILIIGKCFNEAYRTQITAYLSENITYFDKFLDLKDIYEFANKSRFILFPYKKVSILSSGSLMDSIRMRSQIIGPNDGAFKDLGNNRLVYTYDQFDDLVELLKKYQHNKDYNIQNIEEFCAENSWQAFGNKLAEEINEMLF